MRGDDGGNVGTQGWGSRRWDDPRVLVSLVPREAANGRVGGVPWPGEWKGSERLLVAAGRRPRRVIDYNHRRTGAATDLQSLGTPGRRSTLFRLPEASGARPFEYLRAARATRARYRVCAHVRVRSPTASARRYFSLNSLERLLIHRGKF